MRMEQVLSRENLLEALHPVERNKGSSWCGRNGCI
jgi:hypothetical protein